MTNEKKNKHLTLDERIEIQECLNKGMTFKAIAKRIGKDPTTISKEVKLHGQDYSNSFTKTDETCPLLLKAPFVCNGCSRKNHSNCKYRRRIYRAKSAQDDYKAVLVESRSGIPLTKEDFYQTESIISEAVKSGQNIYHAIHTNNLSVSKTTVYRHIERGYYTISKIDLPRAVKFKQRKEKNEGYVPKSLKIGRTFDDFLIYLEENQSTNYVEADTVLGRIGGKLIMTFHFVNVDFMFGLLLNSKTAAEAAEKVRGLKERLHAKGMNFGDIFPIILTDNGGEFSDVSAFEKSLDGNLESKLFFCDPNSSYQKPHVENNHTLLRQILPKGTSFDELTQENVNLVFSHINAVKRKQFNGKSAYDMFTFAYSEEIAHILGIINIPAKEVIQNTKLQKYFS